MALEWTSAHSSAHSKMALKVMFVSLARAAYIRAAYVLRIMHEVCNIQTNMPSST